MKLQSKTASLLKVTCLKAIRKKYNFTRGGDMINNKNQTIMNQIRNGLIVSCQALEHEPLHSSYIMSRMAYAAMEGGAQGIRANSVEDILEIKKTVSLPVIGIIKKDYDDSEVYITPTMKEVDALVGCGTDIIAIDATDRLRPNQETLDVFFKAVREKYPEQLFMADCSTIEEGMHAAEIGFDLIGSTMSGYTSYTKGTKLPNYEMMRTLAAKSGKPVIAEGGIWSGEELAEAMSTGAHAAVVGTAITRPREITKRFVEKMARKRTNLEFKNSGRYQGDNDGPAYVVYSKIGYNKASYEFKLSQANINMSRKTDGKWTNSYIFLGVDVYDEKEEFLNCIDAGFCYAGGSKDWHLFYNLLTTSEKDSFTWYESPVSLDPTHDYRLTLDCSKQDNRATLTIVDLTDGERVADSAEFEVWHAKADGSNLSLYQDFAIDFPDDIKMTRDGKPSEQDWEEITLYNTDEGICLNNIVINNATLYSVDGQYHWTKDRTNDEFMWPSVACPKVDYACTRIVKQTAYSDLVLDLDMNRPE